MKTFTKFLGLLVALSLAVQNAQAQEYRSLNGFNNNLAHPYYGSAGAELPVISMAGFDDGISSPAGATRPNPRFISNNLFMQNTLVDDVRGLSAYTWAWGQFIDHDIVLSPESEEESMNIAVPAFDPFFDPVGTGEVVIPMHRSAYVPGTGTGLMNPRRYANEITAFIDGSSVYGSDTDRAAWLRTFAGGKLKTSAGGLLPYNTTTGEFDAPVSPDAPMMAMPIPFVEKWFVAGDVRANENPFLAAMHTLFVREHNRLCDELGAEHPDWLDEQLYQQARKLVGGIMQAIVYEEWLPALGMQVEPYDEYDPHVNPGIMNVFSTAAFRYGHTTINSLLVRMDNEGNYMSEGDILLRDAYFNPSAITEVGGIEPYFIGMSTVVEQDFDCKVIDDLRNFLFGPPGAGGLDLVALNINRGRDRGLLDYNSVREVFGLPKCTSFSDFTSDPLMNQSLEFVFNGDLNGIDPWVGMLAEDHMHDALFGETAMTIIEQQFMAIRDGDRFYYEYDPWLSDEEVEWIKQTRLADVIRRNSPVTIIQDDIFIAEPILTPTFEAASVDGVSFQVYPNPASNNVTLRVESFANGIADIQVSDMQGRTILEEKTALGRGNNIVSFALPADWPSGLYLVSVRTEDKVGYQRLVKE